MAVLAQMNVSQWNTFEASPLIHRKQGIIVSCTQSTLKLDMIKAEHFKMTAIHCQFTVVEVEKLIPLMFQPFNQPLGMQLQ
jgi:hypothetical protein